MSFKLDKYPEQSYTSQHKTYSEGDPLECQISQWGGFATQAAILRGLPDGKGFTIEFKEPGKNGKIIVPPNSIWTSKGSAIAT